jgi:hypothetical protein
MNTATAIPAALALHSHGTLPNGVKWAVVKCDGSYESFLTTPAAIEFQGTRYGRSCWSSDTGEVVYRSDKLFALSA